MILVYYDYHVLSDGKLHTYQKIYEYNIHQTPSSIIVFCLIQINVIEIDFIIKTLNLLYFLYFAKSIGPWDLLENDFYNNNNVTYSREM